MSPKFVPPDEGHCDKCGARFSEWVNCIKDDNCGTLVSQNGLSRMYKSLDPPPLTDGSEGEE